MTSRTGSALTDVWPWHPQCERAHRSHWVHGANSGHLPSRGDFSSAFLSSSASMTSSVSETQPQVGVFPPQPLTTA